MLARTCSMHTLTHGNIYIRSYICPVCNALDLIYVLLLQGYSCVIINQYIHSYSSMINRGVCSNCQLKLPPNVLTEEQMTKLCTFITEELEQEIKLLSSSQTDHKHFKSSQIRSLKKLINNKGSFDYVIDGLNVAYGGTASLVLARSVETCTYRYIFNFIWIWYVSVCTCKCTICSNI